MIGFVVVVVVAVVVAVVIGEGVVLDSPAHHPSLVLLRKFYIS